MAEHDRPDGPPDPFGIGDADPAGPDFTGLRTDVETATRLPEFDGILRRTRRIRRRDLGRRFAVTVLAVVTLAPAGIIALGAAPGGGTTTQGGPDRIGPARPEPPAPTPSAAAVATIRAIAGTRLDTLYAAVDVCRPAESSTSCSLQVVPLGATAQEQRAPIVIGELRGDPADPLDDVTLRSITPQTMLLSGIGPTGERRYRKINLSGGGAEIEPEPTGSGAPQPQPGDEMVQLRRYGELSFVRQADSQVHRTPSQPPLREIVPVTGITPQDGWWVTGVDPQTQEVAVAVSRDGGRNWLTTSLGLRPGMADPVLATADGQTAYVFVRTAGGLQQRRTVDAGLTWQPLSTPMPWPGDPASRRLGAVVRNDGSLLVWLEHSPGAVFVESRDLGGSYRQVSGPSGPIVAVQDGFVALADPPAVSIDGHTWSPLPRPAVIAP